jgi:hypothetical protein
MAGYTITTCFVLMVSSGIIGVVICLGVAGLTNAIPRFIVLIKGKVIRSLLKNCGVQCTFNMPCFFPYETQVGSLYTGVGIGGSIYAVRIMA